MKRHPVLSIALSLAILGGFLLLFPVEWVGLMVGLLGLVAFQTILVRRHLHIVGTQRAQGEPEPALARGEEAAQTSEGATPAPAAGGAVDGTSAFTAAGVENGAPPAFDPAIFSRFRAHLETAERQGAEQPPATASESAPPSEAQSEAESAPATGAGREAATQAEPAPPKRELPTEADEAVRVVLSPAARRKAAAPREKAMEPPPADEPARPPGAEPAPPASRAAGEEDLFADLRPDPLGAAKGAPVPADQPKGKEKSRGKGSKAASEAASAPAPASAGDEVGAALEKPEQPASPSSEEGAMLLKMAEDALEQEDAAGVKAGLEQALALYEALPGGPPVRARLIQTRLAVLERDFPAVLEHYEQFLKEHPELEEEHYLSPLEQMLAPLEGQEAASLKVSLLQKVLGALRLSNDRRGMDRVYGLMEEAQELAGDEQKLIQYYRNHLEIKKVLEDVEGQLALIDRIGNRYYKLGDTQAAREFYEQGLKLRGEQEASPDAGEG